MTAELFGVPTSTAPSRSAAAALGTGRPSSPAQPAASSERIARRVADSPGTMSAVICAR